MWKGILQGMMLVDEEKARKEQIAEARSVREEDRAFRLDLFNREILENRRSKILEILAERRALDKEVQKEINAGVALGFDRPVAQALYSSGQLPFVVASMEKQDLSVQQRRAINESIMSQLGDRATEDTIADAIVDVTQSGADLNDPVAGMQAIANAVLKAEGIEDLEVLRGQIGADDSSPSVDPFDISMSTANIDLTEVSKVRSEIIKRLQPLFGAKTFAVNSEGQYYFTPNAPADVTRLVTRITDQVVSSATQVGSDQMTTHSAIQAFTNPILDLTDQGPVDVSQINRNFGLLVEGGVDRFFESFTPTAPVVPTPEAPIDSATAMEAMTEVPLSTDPATVEPTNGFRFNINEELD
jgi:hypothetical protein